MSALIQRCCFSLLMSLVDPSERGPEVILYLSLRSRSCLVCKEASPFLSPTPITFLMTQSLRNSFLQLGLGGGKCRPILKGIGTLGSPQVPQARGYLIQQQQALPTEGAQGQSPAFPVGKLEFGQMVMAFQACHLCFVPTFTPSG